MNDQALFDDAMVVSKEAQSNLANCVNRAEKLFNEIEILKTTLKDAEDRYNRLVTDELPQAMVDAQLGRFDTLDGKLHLERKQIIAGTWPKEEEGVRKAVKFLEKENAADLLKCTVIVDFDRGNRESALALYRYAEKLNSKRKVTFKEDVHYQTLNAYLRERLQKGLVTPIEIFNGFVGWVVDITRKEK
jgi:tetratricopeptide (TPR) repeat protein